MTARAVAAEPGQALQRRVELDRVAGDVGLAQPQVALELRERHQGQASDAQRPAGRRPPARERRIVRVPVCGVEAMRAW